jgi:L-xylulokinase
MGRYFLGIDNGNTVSKAALFDVHGKEIAIASCKVDTEYPHPGWTERNMDLLWESTACAIHDVLASSGIRPEEIAGIGSTGHGNGMYLLDSQGNSLRNGIQSMDTRAAGILEEWNQRGLHDAVFPYTIQSFWPAQPNALLAWMKKYEPQNYARIGAILMCKTHKYRLTGEIASDYTDMSGTPVDVRAKRYSRADGAVRPVRVYEVAPH